MCIISAVVVVILFRGPHFDDSWYFRVDIVVGEMEPGSEGALVQQGVLVELNLPAGVALVQAHRAVGKVNHFPQDQLWRWGEGEN